MHGDLRSGMVSLAVGALEAEAVRNGWKGGEEEEMPPGTSRQEGQYIELRALGG